MSIQEHLDAISKATTGLAEYLALHPDEIPQDKYITITDPNGNRLKGFQLCWNEKRKVTPSGDDGDGGFAKLNSGPLVTTLVVVERDAVPDDDDFDEISFGEPDRERTYDNAERWWNDILAAAKEGRPLLSHDEPGRRLVGFAINDDYGRTLFVTWTALKAGMHKLPDWAQELLMTPGGRVQLRKEIVDRFGQVGGTVQDGD